MRISYEWLGDYVDTNGLSPHDAAEFLTMSGTKIESVQVLDLSAIIVGRVLEQKDHPSSNKPLWIHQVDVGGGKVIQIIAGAPNAVAGTLVPVALPGTRVPSGTLVRDAKIAGEAGLLVNPRDQDEIAAALQRTLDDSELAARVGELGRSRAALYTWARSADLVVEAYREASARS